MRSRIRAEAQSVIDNGLSFKKIVVGSPVDYYAPDAEQGTFDQVDDAVEEFTDGDSFDKYLELLKKNKDKIRTEEFFNWLVAQYGSALSQPKREEDVIAKWHQRLEEVDAVLDALKNI